MREAAILFRGIKLSLIFLLGVSTIPLFQPVCMAGSNIANDEYKIRPGDNLFISVWKNEDLSTTVSVRPDGRISFFLVDEILAVGQTPEELKNTLTEKLREFISKPDVTVIVEKTGSFDVYALGEIMRPGRYALQESVSLLHLLSLAGGITEKADLDKSFILREDKKLEVDFKKLISAGDLKENIKIKEYDLIYIPKAENQNFSVFGEVKKPGSYKIEGSASLIHLLSLAGGATERADLESAFILRGKERLDVNLAELLNGGNVADNIEVKESDLVYIPKLDIEYVTVYGEINKPGVIPFRKGLKLADAIAMAGGASKYADISEIKIIRGTQEIISNLEKAVEKSKIAQNLELKPNDLVIISKSFF